MKKFAMVLVAALSLIGLSTAAAGTGSYIELTTPAPYYFGETVNFQANGGSHAFLTCTQNGTTVYYAEMALTTVSNPNSLLTVGSAYYTTSATLSSPTWQNADASCEATIGYWSNSHFHVNASVDFLVGPAV